MPDFESLFQEHADAVFRFCYRLSKDRAQAEDLAQDTFVAAFEQVAKFRGESSPRTWLLRIAYFKARRRWRREKLASLWHPEPGPVESTDSRVVLEEAVLKLPINHRSAFVMVKLEGMSCEEASAVLGAPVGTVKYWVFEAVKRLRHQLHGTFSFSSEESTHVV